MEPPKIVVARQLAARGPDSDRIRPGLGPASKSPDAPSPGQCQCQLHLHAIAVDTPIYPEAPFLPVLHHPVHRNPYLFNVHVVNFIAMMTQFNMNHKAP